MELFGQGFLKGLFLLLYGGSSDCLVILLSALLLYFQRL